MKFRWILGSIGLYAAAYFVELWMYNLISIPNVKTEFEEQNQRLIDNQIDYDTGGLTILAPLAFSDNCSNTYYGCFSWGNFSGADVVVAYQGRDSQKFAIVAERFCSDVRCENIEGFNAKGYFIDSVENSEIAENFNTKIQCRAFDHAYAIAYQVDFCTNTTTGYNEIVSESYYLKVQNLVLSRIFYDVDYRIYFKFIVNRGTRKVYFQEGW